MYKHKILYQYVTVILILFLDQGDGHWKERDKEKLRKDIELYRTMAEKIERDIKSFYDEYSEERYNDGYTERSRFKHLPKYIFNNKVQSDNAKQSAKIEHKLTSTEFSNTTKENIMIQHVMKNHKIAYGSSDNKVGKLKTPWPKFEDILLAMGKKYDWKNDRWIKVKNKIKIQAVQEKIDLNIGDTNSIEFHEKHKFSYSMIKLKNKNRRNLVVAVSAVR